MIAPAQKYRSLVDELESLKVELENPKRPGDPAPVVSRVLEAAGDLLRRTSSAPCEPSLIATVLSLMPMAGLKSWSEGVEVHDVQQKLERAASHAVEAALPDSDDDASTLVGWAMQDLMARDRLESTLVALEASGRDDARALFISIREQLAPVDVAARRQVASLTALNTERRAEAGLLDAKCRSIAWWLTERSGIEDDGLVKVLGGEAKGTLGPAERRADQTVRARRPRSASFDELFRFDLGLSTPAEATVIRSQAEQDPELKLVMAAMAAGDEVIDELSAGEPSVLRAAPVTARALLSTIDVVAERAEYKVLVFRSKAQVQVVVQPRRQDRFAAAAVYLAHEPTRALPSAPGEHGLSFDLGRPEKIAGAVARVVVKLSDGQSVSSEIRL